MTTTIPHMTCTIYQDGTNYTFSTSAIENLNDKEYRLFLKCLLNNQPIPRPILEKLQSTKTSHADHHHQSNQVLSHR